MNVFEARVDRVLGAGPFCEIGRPRVTVTSPDGTLIAIGGALTGPQWHGRDVSRRPESDPGWHPTAVYRAGDLTCLLQVTTRWLVNALAFHPTLPLLAIGTGAYDGGWFHEGELLLLDLTTGATVSVLAYPREVRRLAWPDPDTLALVLAVPSDQDKEKYGTTSLACTIRRDDWDRATGGMLRMPYGEVPCPDDPPAPEPPDDLPWTPRLAVWAVEALPDGRVVAALDDVALECWTPASTECAWQVSADGAGHQVAVLPGGRTALASTQALGSYHTGEWTCEPTAVLEIDLADGAVRATHRAKSRAVLVSRADGRWMLRERKSYLGRYDLFNHYFDIRYAPDLLFLQGHDDKWVIAVDRPGGRVRRLFPLEWDRSRGGHLFGGCGAYLEDRAGRALVHGGTVHDGAGLLPGNAFVARRRYPTGEAQWVFTADHQPTALDVDGEFVYVVFNSGELVVLRATDGSVLARQQLLVNDHRVVPLSLARVGATRLVIGTLDGRLLDCSIAALSDRLRSATV